MSPPLPHHDGALSMTGHPKLIPLYQLRSLKYWPSSNKQHGLFPGQICAVFCGPPTLTPVPSRCAEGAAIHPRVEILQKVALVLP